MEVTMKLGITLALTAMGALAGCGPIEVDLGGADGEAGAGPESSGGFGATYSTGGTGGAYTTGGGPASGGVSSGGAPDGTGVGGTYTTGGGPTGGGAAGAPSESCWRSEIRTADGACIDNDVFLGRAFEHCDAQGASLASISYEQLCDGYTSSFIVVTCCPLEDTGGSAGSGGTGSGTGGAESTGGFGGYSGDPGTGNAGGESASGGYAGASEPE